MGLPSCRSNPQFNGSSPAHTSIEPVSALVWRWSGCLHWRDTCAWLCAITCQWQHRSCAAWLTTTVVYRYAAPSRSPFSRSTLVFVKYCTRCFRRPVHRLTSTTMPTQIHAASTHAMTSCYRRMTTSAPTFHHLLGLNQMRAAPSWFSKQPVRASTMLVCICLMHRLCTRLDLLSICAVVAITVEYGHTRLRSGGASGAARTAGPSFRGQAGFRGH